MMTGRNSFIIDLLLLIQLLCFFAAISFSSGGGNLPDQSSDFFIYIRVVFLSFPVLVTAFILISRPVFVTRTLLNIIRFNHYLMFYLLTAFLLLPFAVNWQYSLIRLFYTGASLFSLLCLIWQHIVLVDKNRRHEFLCRHITYLFFFSVLLPLYAVIQEPPVILIPGFRQSIQDLRLIHPNLLASFYAQIMVWHFFQVLYSVSRKKIAIAVTILSAGLVLLLFSRSVLLALAFSTIISTGFMMRKSRSRIPLILFISSLALVSMLIMAIGLDLINPQSFIGLFLRTDNLDSFYTLTNRTILWAELLQDTTPLRFLFGYGYSVVTENFGIDFGTGVLYGAHNAYLSVLLGSGVVALAFVVIYLTKNLLRLLMNDTFVPKPALFGLVTLYILFLVNCLASEEIGVSLTITFAFLLFVTNSVYFIFFPQESFGK